ncbi:aminotransferase class V-fold PLP-dependent enzyme [Paenibacillus urinalis]|uniref:cysteine desulfurase n=1 Tax=Paenibacillus urinalis TaxID=521520 RepID=A0ABY7XCX6_9BACL|nr:MULTISPECIES: aminotransferase class V-fold PLP-dependent enzyme [Paenibacillus]WDH98748.1 aminotransferase class V-fold PLP-dependent enzyme [Paenibacillus urinalis]WDI02442.1 aminotransferase class V-fold PLP-dependent enzyme [Paenibacillus urinalis]GAK41468.1 putative cysteine desulfurase [Paenibacillus sp. TCA20]
MKRNREDIVYLDHAATSWPKPESVKEAMVQAMDIAGANPGRGSHQMAVQASRVLFHTRRKLAELFHIHNPNDIVYTFNTTLALNMAIKGIVNSGDHIITTMMEHNSVRRPLEYLKKQKQVEVDYLPLDDQGQISISKLEQSIRHHTKLIVVSHSSNLLGSILPLEEIGRIARKHHIHFLVDAAQSAGVLDIDVERMSIDMLAFPGHKGLLGPQGTGGLYIHPSIDVEPLIHGGTGSQSEAIDQPTVRPDRYESGTPNTIGIAGLGAGVDYVLEMTTERIYQHEWKLTQLLMEGLGQIPGIQTLGPGLGEPRSGLVAFYSEKIDAAELAFKLDREFGIEVRAGYHCTPLAHESAGTAKQGAVRASFGVNSNEREVAMLIAAVRELANS